MTSLFSRWPANKQNEQRAEKQKNIIFYKLIGKLNVRTLNITKENIILRITSVT